MSADPYFIPGTTTLRNLAGITDEETLAEYEREVSAVRLFELVANPLNVPLDFQCLLVIHKHIFRDIFPWAGRIRTIAMSKGTNQFEWPERNCPKRLKALRDAGVVVFAGHTAATYEQCAAAEAAGISGYTHLFNAMTPLESRKPGVVGAAIDSQKACFGIIADLHHVHPVSASIAIRAKFRGGAILVTDAMPTVGADEQWFELNGERIELKNGVLRNTAGSLAGSNLTMIEAIRNAAEFVGVDWQESVRMATQYPSAAIQRSGSIGCVEVGKPADLVEVNSRFEVCRVWRRGRLLRMPSKERN